MPPDETYNSDDAACPFCSRKYGDTWELFLHGAEQKTVTCDGCGEPFVVERVISVDYIGRALSLEELAGVR